MFKISDINAALIACFFIIYAPCTSSKEYLIEADVDARAEYNDNIFLTPLQHDSVTGLIVTPTIKGIIKETHWQADMAARLRSNNYSDANINSNDKYFDVTGKYTAERNIFSLNANYDLDSNLNSASSDFGIVGRRINRKKQGVTPQYTRLMTERLYLNMSYAYFDIEYLDAANTGFTPYITKTGAASLVYSLTEKDRITLSMTAVDYTSKDSLLTYQLFMPRLGIEHEFSKTLSANFLAGISRRNSTSLRTQTFDFFGNPIDVTREVDFNDRGFVLNAGITKQLEKGSATATISRDNTANSFGGLNVVDRLKIGYNTGLSELLKFTLNARYEVYNAVGSVTRNTDRKILFFEPILRYSISRYWDVHGSYRYSQRRFDRDNISNKTPSSNRVYVGLSYNFPSLSTF